MSADPSIESLDRGVRTVLRVGLVLAALFLALGLARVWASAGSLSETTSGPLTFGSLASMIGSASGEGLIALGVLVLVITPITRVLVSWVHFVTVRDLRFVFATAFVLAVLALSVRAGLTP